MARNTQRKQAEERHIEPRPEYAAAVRYTDGSRDLFHVKYADNIEEARQLVFDHLVNVASVVVSLRTR